MNVKKIVALAATLACSAAASAAGSYTAQFPSDLSSVTASVGHMAPEVGYFWSAARGDQVSQTFAGTGVFGATSLKLDILVSQNVLKDHVDWDVYVNGVDVGDWTWTAAQGTGYMHETYNFAAIAGDSYEIKLAVKNEVPDGWGSIALNYDSTMTIAAVPEPETYAMMLAGLGALGAVGRRRRGSRTI